MISIVEDADKRNHAKIESSKHDSLKKSTEMKQFLVGANMKTMV